MKYYYYLKSEGGFLTLTFKVQAEMPHVCNIQTIIGTVPFIIG